MTESNVIILPTPQVIERALRPVNGAELFENVRAYVRRFVKVGDDEAVAITLWTMMTYAVDHFQSLPYLHVRSPVWGCGKSTLLSVLEALVARPYRRTRTTPMRLARRVDSGVTLLLDEGDLMFAHRDALAIAFTRIFDDGYRRGGVIEYGDEEFSTFGPKVIASIRVIPAQIADRSIRIPLRRLLPTDTVEPFITEDAEAESDSLRHDLEAWAMTFSLQTVGQETLRAFQPARTAEICRPLLQIAAACSADMFIAGRDALLRLCRVDDKEQSPDILLLGALRRIFHDEHRAKMSSQELASRIAEDETLPFGPSFDKYRLARMLHPFGIQPKTLRIGKTLSKGYERAMFERTWAELLPLSYKYP